MDRNSMVYKARRKMQVIAVKVFGYEFMTRVYYRICLGRPCNLNNPKTLNEKICWLKVNEFGNDRLIVNCSDKYRVRKYVRKKIGAEYLVPLIDAWDHADEIDFDRLPDKYILKCNHGCAYNILVDDNRKTDGNAVRKQLDIWLKEDFSLFNAEPQYHGIKRKIICEEHVGKDLVDYKFFCCNGKIVFYYVSSDLLDDRNARMCHYLPDGNMAPFQRKSYRLHEFPVLPFIDELKNLAVKLAEEFKFVRVDFLVAGGAKVYFSELTFTPGGGYMDIEPQALFDRMGDKLRI